MIRGIATKFVFLQRIKKRKSMNYRMRIGMLWGFLIMIVGQMSAQKVSSEPSIFDYGKMWTFEDAPVGYWNETYGFNATPEWIEASRMSALRFASWCSASFVSPDGLIMTNHHCSNGEMPKLMKEGEDFNKNGFYAETLEQERKDEGLFVEQLVMIADITSEVDALVSKAANDGEVAMMRDSAFNVVKRKYGAMSDWKDLRLQTITYFSGGKYSLYGYKRYDDIRLVFIPELDLGFYGGDPDNFTYPRYNLDCTFWRAYENGKPANTSAHYFPFNVDGAKEGDPVFVIGNPGSTERYRTVAQLEYDRDSRYNIRVESMTEMHTELSKAYDANPDPELLNQIFGLSNGMKAIGGIIEGIHDPVLMARKQKLEDQTKMKSGKAELWDRLASMYKDLGNYGAEISLLSPSGLNGGIMGFMHQLDNYKQLAAAGGDEAEILKQMKIVKEGAAVLKDPKEVAQFTNLMSKMNRYASPDDTYIKGLFRSGSFSSSFPKILNGSTFTKEGKIEKALKPKKIAKSKDPLLSMASNLTGEYHKAVEKFQTSSPERRALEGKISKLVYEVNKGKLPPDATFTLRIADGVVKGYNYNGTTAPYKTTYFGLYDRHFSNNQKAPWSLPERWMNPPSELLSKPMNFVSTNDIIGGNSGSPIINTNREVVGLIFDGNIESLPGNFIYEPTLNRAVSVHAGGIVAALEYIYKADRLAKELRGK